MTDAKIAIITPSYRNDFEHAVDLCRSIDAHLKADFEHIILVPKADLGLFQKLASANRRILPEEDLVKPFGFWRLPIPTRFRIPGIIKWRIREQWYAPGGGRINGWVLQQILKLSAPSFTDAETLIFIDSDVELFRDFYPASLWTENKLRLHEHNAGVGNETHKVWRATARRLLGISEKPGHEANYIGNLIPWRRSNVLKMQERITAVNGTPWRRALAKNPTFSEYILYGIFCREVLGADSGQIFEDLGLYNSIWTSDGRIDEDDLLGSILPSHVALHIQSTIPIALEDRRKLLRNVAARANAPVLANKEVKGAS